MSPVAGPPAGAPGPADPVAPVAPWQAAAWAALAEVLDPETGLDIVAMGLVARLERDGDPGPVALDLVMTSAACPMAAMLADDAEAALAAALGPATPVVVRQVQTPAWHPGRMTAAARAALGWDDLPPP